MLKVVLNDILINLKKSWISILVDMILFIFLIDGIIVLVFAANNSENIPLTNDIIFNSLKNSDIIIKVIASISIILIIFLFVLAKKIPLRLSKIMFVCAAGEKEKMNYMFLQLAVKMIFSFIFIFATIYRLTGKLFANESLGLNIIELTLWFFIILNINLKVGIGEHGAKKKDMEDYIIISKEEEVVNIYWFCLLCIEFVIFYALCIINIPLNLLVIIGWSIVFIINAYIAFNYVTPILKKTLIYEEVYIQIPETKEVY